MSQPGVLRRRAIDVAAAAAAVAAATLLGRLVGVNPAAAGFVQLVGVLVVALGRGVVAGTAASVLATLALNFFFIPPLHTFTIADPANWAALGCFLLVSAVVSRLVVRAREEAAEARGRRAEVEALYDLSLDLFTAPDRATGLAVAAERALGAAGAAGGGLLLLEDGESRLGPAAWRGGGPELERERLAATALARREVAEVPAPGGRDLYFPLAVGGRPRGVLAFLGCPAERRVVEPIARLVALAVEREAFLEENTRLAAVRESEAFKTALLRAVSHDLRSPLTAMSLQVEGLRRLLPADAEARGPLEALAREAFRLGRRVDGLLAFARLEAGKSAPQPEPTPPADLFRAAREALPGVLDANPVHVSVASDCPDLFVDPSLALETLVNLLENAVRAAPAGTPLELNAAPHPTDPGTVRIELADRGPGLGGASSLVGPGDGARSGLGLEIARGFAAASGGRVVLSNRPGGGAVARFDLPAAPALPQEPEP